MDWCIVWFVQQVYRHSIRLKELKTFDKMAHYW